MPQLVGDSYVFIWLNFLCVFSLQGPSAQHDYPLSSTLDGVAAEKRALLDAKLQVIQAFSKALDDTAKQFTAGHTAKFARELAESFTSLCAAATDNQATASKTPATDGDSYAARLKRNLPEGHSKSPQHPAT